MLFGSGLTSHYWDEAFDEICHSHAQEREREITMSIQQGSTGPLNISGLPAAGQDVAAGVPALYCLKYEKVRNMAKFSAGTPLPTFKIQRAR